MFHFHPSAEMKQSGLCDDDGAALRAVQAFCPQGKTLAQAEFTSAEHVKSRLEGSRRGPPRRELDAPPAAQEKAIGYTGPPTEPSKAGRLGAEE